ncbi:hypothetical protein [Nocardioides iriomotensis]|uniref:hypothetical protein n=1 Tax=Nocardioides iriomotensis TaxID=715784 RepID=UPI001F0DC7D6|nr:hypothetical protein [Nocardioides iriomotensis]
MSRAIRRVAVFCGSSPGVDPEVARRSYDVGRGLAERGIGLVYGAGGFRPEVLDDLVVADDLERPSPDSPAGSTPSSGTS